MIYEMNGKKIRIPDNILNNLVTKLQISQEEAVQVYLEDEGILINDEQQALDEKAKKSKITATIHEAKALTKKKTQKERVQKPDEVKENFIKELATVFLQNYGATEIEILNKNKLISFKLGDEIFKLDLIRQRKNKA